MPSPDLCIVSGILYDASGDPLANARFTVRKVVKEGVLVSTRPLDYRTNDDGELVDTDGETLGIPAIRDSVTYLDAAAVGLNPKPGTGVALVIPDAATANLEDLLPAVSVTVSNVSTGQLAALQADFDAMEADIAALTAGAPSALDTLAEFAAALNNDASFAATVTTSLALKAPLLSPALTGTPTAPTAAAATNTTQIATTAHVFAERTNAATLTNKTLMAPVINSPTGLLKADVGLSNVDNTSDANKPVSTAQATALALKLTAASNLSDLGSAATARANLELGTANSPTFAGAQLGQIGVTEHPQLVFSSLHPTAKWMFYADSQDFEAVTDNVFRWGWNVNGEDATEPTYYQQFEQDYKPPGQDRVMEWFLAYYAAGFTNGRRPLQINVNRAGVNAHKADINFAGSVVFKSSDAGATALQIEDAGHVLLQGSAELRRPSAGSQFLKQQDVGGTYRSLLFMNLSDQISIGSEGHATIFGGTGLFSGALTTNGAFQAASNSFRVTSSGLFSAVLWSNGLYAFSSTGTAAGTPDTGTARIAAGVVGASDGTGVNALGKFAASEYRIASTAFIDSSRNLTAVQGIFTGRVRITNTSGSNMLELGDTAGTYDWGLYQSSNVLTLWDNNGGAQRVEFNGANVNIVSGVLRFAGNQVLGARKTGWTLPTSTKTRNVADYSALTLPQLAEVVAALVNDLHSGGGGNHMLLTT